MKLLQIFLIGGILAIGSVESRRGFGKDSQASAATNKACNASVTSTGNNDTGNEGPGQRKRGCFGEGQGLLKGILHCLRRGRKQNHPGRGRGPPGGRLPCVPSQNNGTATPSGPPSAPPKIRQIVQTILQGKQSSNSGLEPDAEYIG